MTTMTPESRIKDFEKRQIVVSVLVLLIFFGLALIFNTLYIQSVAEDNTKLLSRFVKVGDFRETSLILQEARLSKFISIRYKSTVPGRSFILPPSAELEGKKTFWKAFSSDEYATLISNELNDGPPDTIIYEYSRFRFVSYAFFIWLILNLVSIPQTRFMRKRLVEQFHRDLELQKKVAKSELAHQVRHNLRTPLAALMRIPGRLPSSVAKDKDLLQVTINQIKDLVAKLDDTKKEELSDQTKTDIYATLIQARRELELFVPKEIDFHFEIDDMILSTLVTHIPVEMRSILGNLVTNSIEAMNNAGRINIRCRDLGAEIEIIVADTGCGIAKEIQPNIFDKDFSFGKKNGTGVGLWHANEFLSAWGGSIEVNSSLGLGSTLTIRLPVNDRAKWYLPRLKFNSDSKIYVLDDQESGRALWELKFDDTELLKQTKFMSHGKELLPIKHEIDSEPDNCTLLFDYDLGGGDTGLKWLQDMPEAAIRCLVTGHFDNDDVRASCIQYGVYLILKSQIAEIPIVVR